MRPVVAAVAYAAVATLAAAVVIDDAEDLVWPGFVVWLAAPALLLAIASRAAYLLPLVPWLALGTFGGVAPDVRSGWEELWFFSLAILTVLALGVLVGLRAAAARRRAPGGA